MTNKRIIRVLIVISALFLALLTYLLYFNMFTADKVATNPYNQRQWDEERFVIRGSIYDSEGVTLAKTITDDNGNSVRHYEYGNLYSHVIGYSSRTYGKSLLERAYDSELLGKSNLDIVKGDKKKGFDLNLTINNALQKYAYEQMKGRRGALVALNPKTGAVLAMVSLPDFDPNQKELEASWNEVVEREDSPLVSRAIQGLYPPGSTYKLVTLAAAYENGMQGKMFDDVGAFTLGNVKVENYNGKAYGEITLEEAFKVSSNQVFCQVGNSLGSEAVSEIAKRFGIGKDLSSDLQIEKSRIEYKKMNDTDAALVSIGQGQLLVTPIQMATLSSAIANGGSFKKPYLVKSVTNGNLVIKAGNGGEENRAVSAECAEYIKEQMVNVVESGTGTKARISNFKVAGKTGTAENESDKAHSWFVGFAPADEPEIAIAVIFENDNKTGGDTAAPVAGSVMRKYLDIISKN